MEVHNQLSILLVEDDETARDILGSIFSVKFPQITFCFADNGRSGLESFRKHSPVMVITDVNMPVMNGICMAKEIKSIDPGVKLVVLSAFSDKHILESSVSAGVMIDHYISKPVEFDKLFALVEQCLATAASQGSI